MNLLPTLKLIWRKILTLQEVKDTFFHRNEALAHGKKYDYLFRKCVGAGVEMLYCFSEKDILVLKTGDGIIIETNSTSYSSLIEVFIDKIYALPLQINGDFCVFDVGMNRGYASLFFARHSACKEVYGFEIMPETFEYAKRNFALNEKLSAKIVPYNFGLWNEDTELAVRACAADDKIAIDAVMSFPLLEKGMKGEIQQMGRAVVKKSSTVISSLLHTVPQERLRILKIDIEGSEYVVCEDLYHAGIIDKFDLIIGEYHNGISGLEKYLGNFTLVYKSKAGLQANFCYLNNRIKI
jgi:FkbM family methyltransferase